MKFEDATREELIWWLKENAWQDGIDERRFSLEILTRRSEMALAEAKAWRERAKEIAKTISAMKNRKIKFEDATREELIWWLKKNSWRGGIDERCFELRILSRRSEMALAEAKAWLEEVKKIAKTISRISAPYVKSDRAMPEQEQHLLQTLREERRACQRHRAESVKKWKYLELRLAECRNMTIYQRRE